MLVCYRTTQTTHSDGPILTPEERGQVKTGARWLRRVANPFVDFHIIATVGTAMSSVVADVSQRQADPDVQGYLKDLYVWIAHSVASLPSASRSTPIQREIYAEDFKQIVESLPFIKQRLESSSEPSRTIQKILNFVCVVVWLIFAFCVTRRHVPQVQSAADGGKHDDTGTMKQSLIWLIPRKCLPDPGSDDDPRTAQSYVLDL